MKLSERQQLFSRNVAKLILYMAESNYACTFGEAWRTPEMAAIYAKRGTGISHSLHCVRLAVDLLLFKDGAYLTDTESYRPFGVYWQSLDPLNRWGGDWDGDGEVDPGENDGNHFEMKEST
jgi:hypothetical protein